ncbi:MAG: LptF/LptG family permease [Planctomycetota bacterium]
MAGRMDRYVAKAVLGAYAAALMFLVFMVIIIELLLEMDQYILAAEKHDIGVLQLVWSVCVYQAVSVPYVFVTIAPFVAVIAAMFAVSRFMGQNELAPMLFTGRSMFRILRPLLGIGLLSALAMGLLWQTAVPYCASLRHSMRARLSGGSGEVSLEDGILRSPDNDGLILYCKRYYHGLQKMEGVILYDDGGSTGDSTGNDTYTEAAAATWNKEQSEWELIDGKCKRGDIYQVRRWLGMPKLTPELLWQSGKKEREAGELSYTELLELMQAHPHSRAYVLALHQHITFPLANLVLLLLALPFAVHFERGNRIERVAMSIVICGGYLFVDLTCQNLGQNHYLHPVVASWVPTILFGSLGVVVFGGIRT